MKAGEDDEHRASMLRGLATARFCIEDNQPALVRPQIYIGSIGAAENVASLSEVGITHVLSLGQADMLQRLQLNSELNKLTSLRLEVPPIHIFQPCHHMCLNITDRRQIGPRSRFLDAAVPFLHQTSAQQWWLDISSLLPGKESQCGCSLLLFNADRTPQLR